MSEPLSFLDGRVVLYAGDCLDVLETIQENSVDSVVVDPPYHLASIVKRFGGSKAAPAQFGSDGAYKRASAGFMGKQWDGGDIAFRPETWAKVLRVMKPGAHLVAFAATKNSHRMVCAIEDAGFEVRDALQWLYGSGFPKSHNVSKALDGILGKQANGFKYKGGDLPTNGGSKFRSDHPEYEQYEGATDAARQWEGWGTALKPAFEPICLARKPLSEKTIAANVLRWGTGALNIDGCRVGAEGGCAGAGAGAGAVVFSDGLNGTFAPRVPGLGRWPANICHDGSEEVVAAFPKSESSRSVITSKPGAVSINGSGLPSHTGTYGFDDSGSAARFFYSAKADADDRLKSKHPTVKPVDLMRWLVRLVTPPRGTVLDCFAGTGTTGAAAWLEGFSAILIEREEEYRADIARRMSLMLAGPDEKRNALATPDPIDSLPLFGNSGMKNAGGGDLSTDNSVTTEKNNRANRNEEMSAT